MQCISGASLSEHSISQDISDKKNLKQNENSDFHTHTSSADCVVLCAVVNRYGVRYSTGCCPLVSSMASLLTPTSPSPAGWWIALHVHVKLATSLPLRLTLSIAFKSVTTPPQPLLALLTSVHLLCPRTCRSKKHANDAMRYRSQDTHTGLSKLCEHFAHLQALSVYRYVHVCMYGPARKMLF